MPTPKAPADPFDTGMVRKLADILKDKGLTEIEVERGGLKIRVAMAPAGQTTMLVPQPAAPAAAASVAAPAQAPATAAAAAEETGGETVKSPMVGTVYLQAQPGTPAFVKVGDMVGEGQTLLLIEAMKTMNPIGAPRAGRILRLLVTDAQPVEYGEPLVVLE